MLFRSDFIGQETVIRIIQFLNLDMIVISFFFHLIPPIDSKFGNPRFISQYGPLSLSNQHIN